MKHGTESMYANGKCRCDRCKKAASRASRARRNRNKVKVASGEVTLIHGTTNTYGYWGCRCDECKAAARAYQLDYSKRMAKGQTPRKRGRKPGSVNKQGRGAVVVRGSAPKTADIPATGYFQRLRLLMNPRTPV